MTGTGSWWQRVWRGDFRSAGAAPTDGDFVFRPVDDWPFLDRAATPASNPPRVGVVRAVAAGTLATFVAPMTAGLAFLAAINPSPSEVTWWVGLLAGCAGVAITLAVVGSVAVRARRHLGALSGVDGAIDAWYRPRREWLSERADRLDRDRTRKLHERAHADARVVDLMTPHVGLGPTLGLCGTVAGAVIAVAVFADLRSDATPRVAVGTSWVLLAVLAVCAALLAWHRGRLGLRLVRHAAAWERLVAEDAQRRHPGLGIDATSSVRARWRLLAPAVTTAILTALLVGVLIVFAVR